MPVWLIPLIAGGISFLSAKSSGASTRNSLLSGFAAAGASYGLGAFAGAGAAGGAGAGATAGGAGAAGGMSTGTNLALSSGFGTAVGVGSLEDPQQPKPTYSQEDYEAALARENLKPQDYEKGDITYAGTSDLYNFGSDNYVQPTYLSKGGLVNAVPHYAEGGINYLPNKTEHNEKDTNNYVRATGYVEDGSGNGDKEEDTMLAQLADGEFVSRADAVLGAGIMTGANPENIKEMRKKGATFFYNQQDQMKRIHDLVNAN